MLLGHSDLFGLRALGRAIRESPTPSQWVSFSEFSELLYQDPPWKPHISCQVHNIIHQQAPCQLCVALSLLPYLLLALTCLLLCTVSEVAYALTPAGVTTPRAVRMDHFADNSQRFWDLQKCLSS